MKVLGKYPILVECNWLEKNLNLPNFIILIEQFGWKYNTIKYVKFTGKSDYDKNISLTSIFFM